VPPQPGGPEMVMKRFDERLPRAIASRSMAYGGDAVV
jgi:hypothetical protein